MPHHLPTYLHTLRKQWGLSQAELATLFDLTPSALSRFENRSRQPSGELIVATEVIFGHSAKDVFPAFYHEIEREVLERARVAYQRLESTHDPVAHQKLRFLTEIIERANQATLNV